MKRYLLVFVQTFKEFRAAEFKSLCSLFGISQWEYDEPFVASKPGISGETEFSEAFGADRSYCIRVMNPGRRKNQAYTIKRINELDFLPFQGHVDLKEPTDVFCLVEDHVGSGCPGHRLTDVENHKIDSLKSVYFGRLIGKGQMSSASKYNLETRKFIGNTSMDPVLALIQANLALAGPSSLVVDPFVGTGSLLIGAAHFGSYCIGTEINYNLVFGLGRSSRANVKFRDPKESVRANFEQYGLTDRFLDVLLADASRREIWKWKSSFDAVVADPPYGIREKSAKLGCKKGFNRQNVPSQYVHYPEKMKYEFGDVLLDLLNFSAEYLVIGGRLTYWLAVINKEYSESTVPQHPCLKLLHNCEQRMAKIYGRRLIVMEKVKNPENEKDIAFLPKNLYEEKTLRDKIFNVAITKERQKQSDYDCTNVE